MGWALRGWKEGLTEKMMRDWWIVYRKTNALTIPCGEA